MVPDQSQIAKYDLYKVCVEKINYGNNHSTSVINTILSLCQYQESRVSNDFVVKVYISNKLKDYIPLCKKIVDISIMNDTR